MKKRKRCFVIMPFSDTASCGEEEWTEVFECIIKPAVEGSRLGYRCERSKAGRQNIIRGILKSLNEADVVIADLTDNNPNVFYELGVRHTLGKPTILIAQGKEYVPSDLISYPTVFYSNKYPAEIADSKTAEFNKDIRGKLKDIEENPDVSDSPVTDFLKGGELPQSLPDKPTNRRRLAPTSSKLSHNGKPSDVIQKDSQGIFKCARCGFINKDNFRNCEICGADLIMQINQRIRYCAQCGYAVPPSVERCPNCDHILPY